jgi:outer membrane biosynthesis protein TonB
MPKAAAEQTQVLAATSDRRPALAFSRLGGILLAALAALSLTAASTQAAPAQLGADKRKAIKGSQQRTHRAASTSRQRGKGKPKVAPAPAAESTRTTEPAPAPAPAATPSPAPVPAPVPTPISVPAPESEPVPAPAPEPSPAPAPGPNLFDGTKVGSFWINHSAPGAITEAPDPAGGSQGAIKMTVSDKDVYPITPTENPRAELLSPGLIKPGMEFWLSTKFLVPTSYPSIPSNGWVSLVSIYGAPFNGPSPWRLELAGNTLQWQRNETYNWDVPFEMPLPRGKWVEVVTHERFGSDGFVEMWINGKAITFFGSGGYNPSGAAPTERLEMQTMDASNDADANSAKIMQYRKAGMFSSGTVYFGPLRIGASRNAVES